METKQKTISLLAPENWTKNYKTLSDVAAHDLGLDFLCAQITEKKAEQNYIISVLSKMTKEPRVTKYRGDIFDDIYRNPAMRAEILEILDKINFLRDYGSLLKTYDEAAGVWDLLHRLDELNDYIHCIEAIYRSLSKADIHSEGLLRLKEYVNDLYHDRGFEELKKDISALKADTSNLKSVTVGINLNECFEAESVGLISINSKYFTKSNLLGNFCDRIAAKGVIHPDTEWKETYKYQLFSAEDSSKAAAGLRAGLAVIPGGDMTEDIPRYMSRVTNQLLSNVVKTLRNSLNKYVSVTITEITDLIPEFIYYVRLAEYIETISKRGFRFCKAEVKTEEQTMCAKGIYNLKLASTVEHADEIVANNLDFDKEHLVYILTGANRGGKTTITQAVGLLFVLAQGGLFVPGESFSFYPVDCIYTHFPADEDKTMNLGRLGEECKRFRELYFESTKDSLILLNETFSTTSFEEGYYIAKDSVRAILEKGVRTLYNTHMHKLAYDIEEINDARQDCKAVSLVMKSQDGTRSYQVEIAKPEGMSYANDIAKKYGVTYEMLTEEIKK